MNAKDGVWIVIGAACSACAPLQQAPLVYSSKITVGVDVAGTSTETPGFSFAVGYKQVDAAYVPVAVAKPCDSGESTASCSDKSHALQLIAGQSTSEAGTQSGAGFEQAQETLRRYKAAVDAAIQTKEDAGSATAASVAIETRIASLRDRQSRAARMSAQVAANRAEQQALQGKKTAASITEPEAQKLSQLDLAAQEADSAALSTAESTALGKGEAELTAARAKAKAAQEGAAAAEVSAQRLAPLAEVARQLLDKVTRRDAYSVYGRFEGNIVGESGKASVGLGKVFSTGVASQSLATGLQKYYEGLGSAACFDSVAKLAITDETKKLELLATCRGK